MASTSTRQRGVVWDLKPKPIDATYQPCTSTWKIEPYYSDSHILLGNWKETSARAEHEAKPQHRKYMLPKPVQIIQPNNDIVTPILQPIQSITKEKRSRSAVIKPTAGGYADGILADARTRPYKKYFNCHLEEDFRSKCDIGSQCNPVFTSKLSTWHHTNLSNYTPEDLSIPIQGTHEVPDLFQFPMKDEPKERVPPFPYPKQWIVNTPMNYGLSKLKRQEWKEQQVLSGVGAPVWGHDLQRNTSYRAAYPWPPYIKKKSQQFKFHKDIRPPIINDLYCPYRGFMNEIYSRNQTSSALEKDLHDRTNHVNWRFYSGVRG